MTRSQVRTATIVAIVVAVLVLLAAPLNRVADEDQRPGLVSTATMFEDTHTHYPSGAEFAQAVYASQGIDISTDIVADSYVSTEGALRGDIVIGEGYVGILTGEGVAMGVALDGGPVQEVRVTTEEVRRVDW